MSPRTRTFIVAGIMVLSVAASAMATPASGQRRRTAVVQSIADRGATIEFTLDDGAIVPVARELVRVRGQKERNRSGRGDLSTLSAGKQPAAVVLVYRSDGSVRRARVHLFASDMEAKRFARRPLPSSDR